MPRENYDNEIKSLMDKKYKLNESNNEESQID